MSGEPGQDLGQQGSHPQRRLLPGGDDLAVIERLVAEPGSEVGDQGDAEDLGAQVAGGDGFKGGGHADEIRSRPR